VKIFFGHSDVLRHVTPYCRVIYWCYVYSKSGNLKM